MKIQASSKVKKLKYPTAAALAAVTGALCSCEQSQEPQPSPGIRIKPPQRTGGVVAPKNTQDTEKPPILGGIMVAPDTDKEPQASKPTVIPQGAVGSVPRQ